MHKSQDQDRKHFQDTRNFPLASFNYPKGNHFSDFHPYKMVSLVFENHFTEYILLCFWDFFFKLTIMSIRLTNVVCVAVIKQHSIAWISKTYFCVLLMAIIRFFSLELLWIKLLKLLWSFVYLSFDGHLYTQHYT